MKIIFSIISIWIFIYTLSYSIYEYKHQNKSGGIICAITSVIGLIFPNIMLWIREV